VTHPRINEAERLTCPPGSASSYGYRMPGEFERLSRVWLSPPVNAETWPGCLDGAQKQFVDWVDLLNQAVPVRTTDGLGIPTNDSWIRDFGPLFVVRDKPDDSGTGTLPGSLPGALPGVLPGVACHDFHFNTWGGKYEVRDLDDVVPQHIARELGLPIWVHDFVLEGGSIDVNGRGTVLTTEQCLLNPNRNPGLTRDMIEAKLHETLGTRHVIWLPGGIEGDDTDGHIDDVARFISPDTVAVVSADKGHPDHDMTRANLRTLREAVDQAGRALNIVELPVPEPIHYDYPDGRAPVPASYANFLIANKHLFLPVFGQPADDRALGILAGAMPGYSVVPVRAEHLVVGLGALHCLSQQQPAGSV
jgi:agmatine deiminase